MSVYLIDGHNLLHQLLSRSGSQRGGRPDRRKRQEQGRLSPDQMADERRRLVDAIASFMGSTSDRAVIVFDSDAATLQAGESATAQVEVFFGSFSLSADEIIEREVFALTPGETVIVVTSDNQLQRTVFRTDVLRCSSGQFADRLQEYTKRIANRQDCITIGHRVEDRIPRSTLEGLMRLRDGAAEDKPDEGGAEGPG